MDIKDTSSDTPRTPSAKKPYETPSFRYEKVFVTTALSCGKLVNGGGACNGQPKVS